MPAERPVKEAVCPPFDHEKWRGCVPPVAVAVISPSELAGQVGLFFKKETSSGGGPESTVETVPEQPPRSVTVAE